MNTPIRCKLKPADQQVKIIGEPDYFLSLAEAEHQYRQGNLDWDSHNKEWKTVPGRSARKLRKGEEQNDVINSNRLF